MMRSLLLVLLAIIPLAHLQAQDEPVEPPPQVVLAESSIKLLNWRSIGPAIMGGRLVDVAVVAQDPSTIYVATASGGLFKTVNNGTTFTPLFQDQSTISIGDVCVAPSDPNIVWIGTGEHNGRNSVSWGDGVYKSTDGGASWENMGLRESYQVGRIAIHPTNPDIVYVGALGRLWGDNEQRGVFKTSDGGASWEKVLYVDEATGCVDVAMHPTDPDTLMVAMYERRRGAFDAGDPLKRWGPGSGIFKTTNGGKSWKRIKKGLPSRPLGRIGIRYYDADPNVLFAVVESDRIGTGPASAFMGINGGQRVPNALIQGVIKEGPAEKAGILAGDVIVAVDDTKITTYNSLVVAIRAHKPGDKVKITLLRDEEEIMVSLTFTKRTDQGNLPFSSYLGGQRANAQQQQGPKGDQSGGIYRSQDGGNSWERINSLNPRPFYYSQIHVDPTDANHVYVLGIQLHYSADGGKTFKQLGSAVHPDHHALWIDPRDGRHLVLGCDGGLYESYDRGKNWSFNNIMAIGQFYDVGIDDRPLYRVYGGLQDNGSWGGPNRTRTNRGTLNSDWIRIGGGDGFLCRVDPDNPDLVYYESQYGRMARVNTRTGARTRIAAVAPEGTRYRFNWKTPFLLSPHNSQIYFCAGNHVFRSLSQGDKLEVISPEITRTDQGSATALAQSPRNASLIYVGTDDGYLWVTRNGGTKWENITKKLGLPGHFHVSTIEASRFVDERAYVTFDGHRSDNDAPHVLVTEDAGESWQTLSDDLPSGSSRTLREDPVNQRLLYLGTEFAVWVSLDRGQNWSRINNNLPTVAIHEIAVHSGRGEIVAATHGRSLWTLDISPLRQMTGEAVAQPAQLFQPTDTIRWSGELGFSRYGQRHFTGQNPPAGCAIYYRVSDAKEVTGLEIHDVQGTVIRQIRLKPKPGLNVVYWDLRKSPPLGEDGKPTARFGPAVEAGTYLVVLKLKESQLQQPARVIADPELPEGLLSAELEEFERKQRPMFDE